jgi:uncharacterized protein (TIGR02265 family)
VNNLDVDFAEVSRKLDLERRLHDTPATARVRGVFARLLQQSLRSRGLASSLDVASLLGEQPRSYRLYPARAMLIAYARAGALVHSDPGEGIRTLFREIADPFSRSWYGRTLQRLLRPDPISALEFLERSRDHMVNFGMWRVEPLRPGHAVLHIIDEYFWIETAHRGGCEGLLTTCGVSGSVSVELDSLYCGRLDVRWQLRN